MFLFLTLFIAVHVASDRTSGDIEISLAPSSDSIPVVYVSPGGKESASGTRGDPLDLSAGLNRACPDTAIELLAGIYHLRSGGSKRDQSFMILGTESGVDRSVALGGKKSIIRAARGERVIITGESEFPPGLLVRPFTRVEGIWFGGKKDQRDNPVQATHDIEIVGCAFFGYYGGIVDAQEGNLYEGNMFVNCGAGTYFHSLYLSGQPTKPSRGTMVQGNVFLGGGGYHVHLWHKPRFHRIISNFSGDSQCSIVLDGSGILARDNILWSNRGKVLFSQGDYTTKVTFVHNLIGKDVGYYRWYEWPGCSADSTSFVSDACQLRFFGTSTSFWPSSESPSHLGASPENINRWISAIENSFAQPLSTLLGDDSVSSNWNSLQSVLHSWVTDR